MDWNMRRFVFFLAFVFCITPHAFSQDLETQNLDTHHSQSYDVMKLLKNYAEHVSTTHGLKSASEDELDFLSKIADISPRELKIKLFNLFLQLSSNKCFKDLEYVDESLKEKALWAIKMLDSYGKPESGLLVGNLKWVGEYDECLGIKVPNVDSTETGGFGGRYCTLSIPLSFSNRSLPVSTAVCLPDSCNPNTNIRKIFGNIVKDLDLNITLDESTEEFLGNMTLSCKPTTRTLTGGAIAVITFLSLFAVLAFIGSAITAYEYYTKSDATDGANDKPTINGDTGRIQNGSVEVLISEPRPEAQLPEWLERSKPFFNCFCVFTNGEKILNVASSEGQLPSLHGIRFLSMSWVILCHSYAFLGLQARNIAETLNLVDHWIVQIILNGFYSVDSFFLLSGFLVAYLFFQQCAKSNGKIPWVYFYVHRYIRLTPVYLIVMLFNTFVYPYLGDGPLWPEGDYDTNCKQNWWWNLLDINNFQPAKEQCMAWSWYLANDMQFYVISPLFLVTLWRWPKVGYALIGIGLLTTFVINFTITLVYESFTGLGNLVEAASNLQVFMDRWTDFFNKIYTKPYTRVGPYLLGILLAYEIYKWKQNNPKKLKLTTLAAGWAIASAVTLACLFGLYHQSLTTVEAGFYNGLNRIGFAMGLSWVIYVCVTGQGDVVNSLLSWKVWIPLSRLTYCAYLIHPIIQSGYYGSVRRPIEFSHITVIMFYCGYLIISYSGALVTTLLFESPVIRLEKFIRNKFSS